MKMVLIVTSEFSHAVMTSMGVVATFYFTKIIKERTRSQQQ